MPDCWAARSLGIQEKKLHLAGLRSRLSQLAETEKDTSLHRTEGNEIEVEGGVVIPYMDNHARINDVLMRASPLDMSLMADVPVQAILPLPESA
jgi:hypothetical protein